MFVVDIEKVEQTRIALQTEYDKVVKKATDVVATIPAISEETKAKITAQLESEYGDAIKQKLDFVLGFYKEVPDEQQAQ